MEMSLKRNILLTALAAICPAIASAQYDQEINVDGKYLPEYIDRDRISIFPVPLRPEVAQSSLQYSTAGVVADFTPQAIPIPATGWRASRRVSSRRGYIDLGLGSYLQSTLSAGYRIIDTDATTIGVRLQHNSTSLWKPQVSPLAESTRMRRYDEMIGLYASHAFENAGRLDASAFWHLGNFNYYAFSPANSSLKPPTQTLNDAALRIDWTSAPDAFSWYAGAGVRYFGMRRVYSNPVYNDPYPASLTGGRETDVSFRAGLSGHVTDASIFGADLDAHALIYADYEPRHESPYFQETIDAPASYGNLALSPYYRLTRDRLDLRIGVRLDFAMNARDRWGERYRTLNVAPDIRLGYDAGAAQIFLNLRGGNELSTLAARYDNDYYCTPAILSTTPAYSPIDAKAGVNFGPFSGFHIGFETGYKVTFRQQAYGWYQVALGGPSAFDAYLPEWQEGLVSDFNVFDQSGYTLRGLTAGVNIGYDAGQWFKIDARGTYQPQNGKKGYFNGLDRPRWTASATAETNPWRTLRLKLGFDFRAVRAVAIPSYIYQLDAHATRSNPYADSEEVLMARLPHWVSLSFGASYDFTDAFGIWVQLDNITNRQNLAAPAQPLPGIAASAGISWLF